MALRFDGGQTARRPRSHEHRRSVPPQFCPFFPCERPRLSFFPHPHIRMVLDSTGKLLPDEARAPPAMRWRREQKSPALRPPHDPTDVPLVAVSRCCRCCYFRGSRGIVWWSSRRRRRRSWPSTRWTVHSSWSKTFPSRGPSSGAVRLAFHAFRCVLID